MLSEALIERIEPDLDPDEVEMGFAGGGGDDDDLPETPERDALEGDISNT